MLLVWAWARFRPAPMFSGRLHVSGQCYTSNIDYGLPGNTCTVITLTHHPDVMVVTVWARIWKDCIALELKQRRYLRTGVSAVFLIGFFVTLMHAVASLVILLSALFPANSFCSSEEAMESPISCLYRVEFWRKFRIELVESSPGTSITQKRKQHLDTPCWWNRHGPNCTLLSFTLLQGRCSQFCMMPHRAPLPVEVCLLRCGTIVTTVTSESCTFEAWILLQLSLSALLMDPALLIDTKRVSLLPDLNSLANLFEEDVVWKLFSPGLRFGPLPTRWHSSRFAFRKVSPVEERTSTNLSVHVLYFQAPERPAAPRHHCHHVFLTTSRTRQSRPSPFA